MTAEPPPRKNRCFLFPQAEHVFALMDPPQRRQESHCHRLGSLCKRATPCAVPQRDYAIVTRAVCESLLLFFLNTFARV